MVQVLGLIVAVAVWVGCSESPSPAADPPITTEASTPGETERVVLRPGDKLLDHLQHARLVQHPDTTLPTTVAELARQPLVEVYAPLPPDAWRATPAIPADVVPLIDADPGLALWVAVPPISPSAGGDGTGAFSRHGVPVPTWDGSTPELLAAPVLWYPRQHGLLALAHAPPEGVECRVQLSSGAEFGPVERGRLLLGRDPLPADLLDRFDLGSVNRPALLLAGGGVLEWTVDAWEADALEIATGLIDRGWIEVDGSVQRTPSGSDGVTLAIEVDGERVWERTLGSESAGKEWVEEVVHIPVRRGEGMTLRLATEAGPTQHSTGDYAVWGSLRAVGVPVRVPDRPHVVVIDIDTLRADRLAAYRRPAQETKSAAARTDPQPRVTTPGIDAWAAAHATIYTDSVSTAPWTLPSTVSLLTGLAVHQHGVKHHEHALAPTVPTLASRLSAAGYETWAMVAGAYLGARYGGASGFDRHESRDPRETGWDAAIERLTGEDSERPVFIFLQTYAVHQPYPHDPMFTDPGYAGVLAGQELGRGNLFDPVRHGALDLSPADLHHVEAQYDALVVHMDRAVADFLVQLQERVDPERLLVVFTSDHGEAFLEHGVLAHGQALYDELLRVPLVVQYPDGATGTDTRPASGLDLVPTVLDVVGLPPDPTLPGRSLRASPGTESGQEIVRLAEYRGRDHAVHSGGYKLIETHDQQPSVQLFVLQEDPGELHDRAAELPGVVDDLRRRRDWFLAMHPPAAGGEALVISSDAEQLEQLRALGYLGDG